MNWFDYYINITKAVALKSKDPSTKIGAIIVSKDHKIISTGFNGFPRGYPDNYENMTREDKLFLTVHAEENAIVNAARHGICTDECSIYLSGLPPCHKCAGIIVQAGIKLVAYESAEIPDRWRASTDLGSKILNSCRVEVQIGSMSRIQVHSGE